ncbi:MAG: preprotein translocase subunit SecG [Fidelibacterota bacterium]
MVVFLITIHTLVSILLIAVILMQASQGGGLAGSIGGGMSNAIFGTRGTATILSKITTWLAVAFMALAILISLFTAPAQVEPESILKQQAETHPIDLPLPATSEGVGLTQ